MRRRLLELSQLGLTLQDILGPVASPWGGVQGTAPGFRLRQLPAAVPAPVPLGIGWRLCCNFSLCSVGLSLLLTGVILTAFPHQRPAIKPPSERPSLEDQTQHPTPRQPHHVICASQSPQSLGKSKSLHVFVFYHSPHFIDRDTKAQKGGVMQAQPPPFHQWLSQLEGIALD